MLKMLRYSTTALAVARLPLLARAETAPPPSPVTAPIATAPVATQPAAKATGLVEGDFGCGRTVQRFLGERGGIVASQAQASCSQNARDLAESGARRHL